VQHFVSHYPFNAVIVRYKGDADTNYSFQPDDKVRLVYKDEINVPEFIKDLQPSAIVVTGWSDKIYTSATKRYIKQVPVIVTVDNPWQGLMRQKALTAVSPWFIHSFSNCAWVPGWSQYEYVRRLGFAKNRIMKNMYCADTEKFYIPQPDGVGFKLDNYPRTIVYVGRMVDYKQPQVLARVFSKLAEEKKCNWKLILAGEGPLKKSIQQHNYTHVEMMDFIDPKELPEFYRNVAGVFCLPSHNEHWGVSVHEAAAAGLPLLLSDSVESASAFLVNGYNGFSFRTGSEKALELSIGRIMDTEAQELVAMGNNSIRLSKNVNHAVWSAELNNIVTEVNG
jgi:glycosyltransferase involved in cell wall biosynthesis